MISTEQVYFSIIGYAKFISCNMRINIFLLEMPLSWALFSRHATYHYTLLEYKINIS